MRKVLETLRLCSRIGVGGATIEQKSIKISKKTLKIDKKSIKIVSEREKKENHQKCALERLKKCKEEPPGAKTQRKQAKKAIAGESRGQPRQPRRSPLLLHLLP